MYLRPQDIIIIEHVTFKDNNKVDSHLYGRPAILINASPEFLYFLTISTHLPSKNNRNPYQYFAITPKIGLKKNSYINLKNIYKIPTIGYRIICTVPEGIFYKTLQKLKYYQENIYTDSLYPEIREETTEMIRKLKR